MNVRYYWDPAIDDCIVRMSNSSHVYGYEYLGASPRLVITPRTVRHAHTHPLYTAIHFDHMYCRKRMWAKYTGTCMYTRVTMTCNTCTCTFNCTFKFMYCYSPQAFHWTSWHDLYTSYITMVTGSLLPVLDGSSAA
jgi:hypothetical protein